MPAREPPPDDSDDLRARLTALKSEIRAREPAPQRNKNTPQTPDSGMGSAMSMGLKAGSEFVAAILVGGAIGWGLDWLLHTKPLLTIVFFLLGVVAGVLNVIRATSPKGGNFVRDSRLSDEGADGKDVPRVSPRGGDGREG
jgi:ATP synthase protein I